MSLFFHPQIPERLCRAQRVADWVQEPPQNVVRPRRRSWPEPREPPQPSDQAAGKSLASSYSECLIRKKKDMLGTVFDVIRPNELCASYAWVRIDFLIIWHRSSRILQNITLKMSKFRLSHALTLKKDTETQLKVCHDCLHQDLRESEINEHKVKSQCSFLQIWKKHPYYFQRLAIMPLLCQWCWKKKLRFRYRMLSPC